MSDALSALKEEDVQQLARLIESLEQSTFDYLQLQVGDMKVTIGKGSVPAGGGSPAVAAPDLAAYAPPVAARPAPAPTAPQPVPAAAPSAKRAVGPTPAGMVDIRSEIMGMFYAQPDPGAPPFVTIGSEVKEDTTVCLVEVMKTFNAIPAGVRGVITEICVDNAQLVEYGQVLFRARPS